MKVPEISVNKTENNEDQDFLYHKFNLFQQFYVISLDPKIMYNINEIDLKNVPEPLSLPKVISKYPNGDLPHLLIPDNVVASHCFPQGIISALVDYEEKDLEVKISKTESFIFYLDNMFPDTKVCSLNISKVYYTCLLFYEDIENYRSCINQRTLYKNMEVNDSVKMNKGLLIPKVICLSSFSPFYEETKYILKRIKNYVDNFSYNKRSSDNVNPCPIEKIIEGLIFTIPSLPRGNCLIKLDNNSFSINPNNDGKLQSLNEMIEYKENNSSDNEINEIIFKEIPPNKIPRSVVNYSILMYYFRAFEIFDAIKFIILEEPILVFCEDKEVLSNVIIALVSLIYPFQYPHPVVTILPEQNFSFITIFKHFIFGINTKYSEDYLSKKISLEGIKFLRIIRLDKRFSNVINSGEQDNLDYSVFTSLKADENKPLIKIDQNGGNAFEKDKEDSRIINEKKNTKLPRHYSVKCIKRLEDETNEKIKEAQYKNKNKKLSNEEKENIFNKVIKEVFLYFFSCILLKYQDFCVKYEKKIYEVKDSNGNAVEKEFEERNPKLDEKYYIGNIEINDIFDCKGFIGNIAMLDRQFYKILFETKVFFSFIHKKIFPDSTQDKLDVLFFDETINKKLGRESRMQKLETPFLEFDYESEVDEIKIKSLKRSIGQNFNKYLQKHDNRVKALNYFQYIYSNFEDNDLDEEIIPSNNNQMYFYYFVFPILFTDGIFYEKKSNKNKNLICSDQLYFESKISNRLYEKFENDTIAIIDHDTINKNYKIYDYSLNPTCQFHLKNEYMIKMLWLRYLSKTFHNIPNSKKKYYFELMMLFLRKNKNIIDERTILIIFNCLNKYGDRNMNQDFFVNIQNKTYISYLCLREKTKPENNFTKFMFYLENNNQSSSKNVININNSSTNLSLKSIEAKNLFRNQQKITIIDEPRLMTFKVNYFCSGKKEELNLYQNSDSNLNTDSEDNICNEPINEKISELYSDADEYIQCKCNKCFKDQKVSITCEYDDEDNKFIIDFELLSPMALLKQKWFQNCSDLEPSFIAQEYLESYLSAIFYFYEQNLPCEFLMPTFKNEVELKETKNVSYSNINSQDIYDKNEIDKIIIFDGKKDEDNDVNDKGLNFMENEGEGGDDEGDKRDLKDKRVKSCFKSSLKALRQKTVKNVEFSSGIKENKNIKSNDET